MWPMPKRRWVKKGVGSDWVSEELFLRLFSSVFKLGKKGFGTGPGYQGNYLLDFSPVCSKKGLAVAPGIGEGPDSWHPPAEYITSENTIYWTPESWVHNSSLTIQPHTKKSRSFQKVQSKVQNLFLRHNLTFGLGQGILSLIGGLVATLVWGQSTGSSESPGSQRTQAGRFKKKKIEMEIDIGNPTSVACGLLGVKRKRPPYFWFLLVSVSSRLWH